MTKSNVLSITFQRVAPSPQLPASAPVRAGQAVPPSDPGPARQPVVQGDLLHLRGEQRHPQAAHLHARQPAR